jgi:predicted outer membrane protein
VLRRRIRLLAQCVRASRVSLNAELPTRRLPSLQSAEMTALNAAAATNAFDRVYIAQPINDHERTLTLVDASLARATRPEIVTMLQQARPKIVAHLDMAPSIQATIGQP